MFVIDSRSRTPIYEQLLEQLRWQVTMGYLKPDEALPSVRSLSAELGINPNTIQKAYRQMEHEGLIYSRPGRGSFVTPSVTEQRKKQQESQLLTLRKELERAKEIGILKEQIGNIVDSVYQNGE